MKIYTWPIVAIDFSFSFSVKKAAKLYVAIFFSVNCHGLSLPSTRMPLGYPIQDGDSNIVGVKRGPFRYMKQNFRRNELLDFVSRDFSEYAWSLRALDGRLEFFNGTT